MWGNTAPRPYNGAPPSNYYQPPQPPPQQAAYHQYSAPPPAASHSSHYAPAAPPPSMAQPQLQSQPPLDPFRQYYADRLRQLTFNSRPIIQDLSMIAMTQRNENNWTNMQAVVDEIEVATLRALPTEKLPKLYLIDSISKNIGQPYTTHLLPPIIPRLYARIYREVDGVTKAKMEEMIGLWRQAAPDGTDLYGAGVREAVERDIFGSMGYQRSGPPTREKVAATMRAALEYHHRESANRPWDVTASQNLQVLMQLNELLSTRNLPPSELQMIMDQLTAMAPKPAVAPPAPSTMPPPTLPTPPMQPAYTPPVQQPTYNAPPPTQIAPTPTLPPFPPNMPPGHLRVPSGGTPAQVQTPPQYASTPVPPSAATPQPTAAAPSAIPTNVLDILRNLNTSGILSAPRTPDAGATPLPRTRMSEYEDMILALDVKLDQLDLNQMHELPLSHLPERCTQCFLRFAERGAKFEAHMDWHFRRNKQERQSEGRGAHRRWLPRGEEWVNDLPNAEAGPSTSPHKPTAEVASKLNLDALRKRWVKVPTDPTIAAQPCPICKEPFKSEWSEEEETWVWRNAIEVNGKIYHATCRAELLENRRLAKLKAGGTSRSLSKSKSPGSTPFPELKEVKLENGVSGVGGSHLRMEASAIPASATPELETQSTVEGAEVKQEPLELGLDAESGEIGRTMSPRGSGKRKVEEEEEKNGEDGGEIKRVKVDSVDTGVMAMDSEEQQSGIQAGVSGDGLDVSIQSIPEVVVLPASESQASAGSPHAEDFSKSSSHDAAAFGLPSDAKGQDAIAKADETGADDAEEDMIDEQVADH